MVTELRKTGISVVGDIPWGAHFCYFYETKQDLLDILIPYFKAGLENKEFCLWVISNSELLTVEEATSALRNALPDLDRYMAERSIEVVGHEDWFLSGNTFDPHQVAARFRKKLNEALARGYAGMRVNGSPAWLHDAGPKELRKFEAELDKLFPNERTIASCTYPLATIGADEIFDVVRTHQFAIARRQGEWEVVETPELIQAKHEIKRLNEELEQRVVERTRELAAANEELKREIGERQQAEDALRRSEDRIRLIIDTIPTMAWTIRPDGVIDFVNKRWVDYTGLSLAEEIEEPTRPMHPEDLPRAMEKWRAKLAVGEPSEDEMRLRRADGEYRWFLIRTAPLRDEQGNLVKWYGVSIDIEDRKHAEEKLKQSESQLAEGQRLAHVGSWDYDLRTNNVTWSDELYRIFGIQPGKIKVAGDAMPFIHPEDRDLVFSTVKSSIKSKEPYSFYYRALRPDGEERIVQSRGFIVSDENGNPIKVVGATQDVTELKHTEEAFKATSDQMRALSARLSTAREAESIRIAREIHDELGSMLTTLKWDLEEIQKTLSTPVDQSRLAGVREKLSALMKLTDMSVSTLRRIASELRPSVLDDLGLAPAIEWQTQQFQARTGIICDCDCSLENIELSAEQSTAVFRIFQEALTNVLRHAQATRVDIKINEEKSHFVLSVSDNGKGITDGDKSEQQSLGILGMRERAHLIGGEMEIKGVEGKGTVVVLRVPISGQDRVLKMTR